MTETNYKHEYLNAEMTINLLLHLLNEWANLGLVVGNKGMCVETLMTTQSVIEIAKRDGRI